MSRFTRVAAMAATICLLVAVGGQAVLGAVEVDSALKPYEKVSGVSGNINSVGSDTLNNLMTYWLEEFKKIYPNVTYSIKGEGSGTAPPALIEGTAQIGPMSRKMKPGELDAFEKKFGFKPTTLNVALDCVAVYVHKDNPIEGLTIPQVDCIFSQTRKSGYRDIVTWSQVGLGGSWNNLPISLYGRNSVSGTYSFFKDKALLKGDYKDSVKEQPGSAAVVNAVANDRGGVGYSGIGYKTSEVRAIALSKDGQTALAEPTFENALTGKYPLGRSLMINVVKKPNEPLPLHIKEFVKFVLSKEGQEVVIKDGYGPMPAAPVDKELSKVE